MGPAPKAQATIRPTKKQRELLTFIEEFIEAKGYSPSYREIRDGLAYNSVATVALHVNNLIKRGHLQKRDHSARSLEVVNPSTTLRAGRPTSEPKLIVRQLKASEEKWLVEKIEIYFKEAESAPAVTQPVLDQLHILAGALKVLGAHGAASSFTTRLSELKKKQKANQYLA